jgi:hypothetical protein
MVASPQSALRTPPWLRLPVADLLFALYAFVVIALSTAIDRTFLIDQSNYVDNFIEGARLEWLDELTQGDSLFTGLVVQLFSEEMLWRVWTSALGLLFEPTTAVQITVCVLAFLIIAATWRLPGHSLALALWLLLPVGFAVTGLLQLRQGLAFAVMLYFAAKLRRPVLGTFIAAMIHTTFAVALIFAVVAFVLRRYRFLAMCLVTFGAFAGAYLGGILFEIFGGRRLLTYSVAEGATSLNYVYTGVLCILPSIYWLMTREREEEGDYARMISILALVHIGATAFTLFSFFLFPLGAGRIGYLTQLLLIPILPAVFRRHAQTLAFGIVGVVSLYLIYLVAKSYFDGTYQVYFSG